MEKIRTEIIYTLETTLNIKEDLLPYVKVAVIGKPITDDKLVTIAVDYAKEMFLDYPEIDYNINNISFKKLSKENVPEKYKLYINIGFYVETDKKVDYPYNFFSNPVNLMVLIYYLNSRGQYESKKYYI